MLRLYFFVIIVLQGDDAFAVFENELVKRIFQQPPDFCFKPLENAICNETGLANTTSDGLFPEKREKQTLAFLFTKQNPIKPEFLHECALQLPVNSNFNSSHKTEVIIHGFLDGVCRSAWMREMRNELLKRGAFNVILIDWTWGNGPNYTESAGNTKIVGKHIALLIQNIMVQSGVGPENFHIVGHSLGAHAAGFAGKVVQHLRRITALDPALAPFQNKSKTERLDPSDANLVDVIHTNGGTKVGEVLGDINPLGHADFYPNGGTHQAGCRQHIVKSYLTLDFLYATISLVPRICSHMHAVQYYKASINSKGCEFIGVECPDYDAFLSTECTTCFKDGSNCAIMGMNLEGYFAQNNVSLISLNQQSRKFYLNTSILHPYCDNSALKFEKDSLL